MCGGGGGGGVSLYTHHSLVYLCVCVCGLYWCIIYTLQVYFCARESLNFVVIFIL